MSLAVFDDKIGKARNIPTFRLLNSFCRRLEIEGTLKRNSINFYNNNNVESGKFTAENLLLFIPGRKVHCGVRLPTSNNSPENYIQFGRVFFHRFSTN